MHDERLFLPAHNLQEIIGRDADNCSRGFDRLCDCGRRRCRSARRPARAHDESPARIREVAARPFSLSTVAGARAVEAEA